MIKSRETVFYPPVGMAHITDDLSDLIKYRLNGQTKLILNTSAQPNSSPHLGTITTIMTTFALAAHFREKLGIEVEVLFDELENSPAETYMINGQKYYRDQRNTYTESGISNEENNMKRFNEILENISKQADVKYSVRSFNEFQENKYVRKSLIDIVNDQEYFSNLLYPKDNYIHLRGVCPTCKLGLKSGDTLVEEHTENELKIFDECPEHGKFVTTIREDNNEYVDINTQLRDLTKGVAFIEEDKINNTLTIMVDGGDWAGIWAERIHKEGMVRLGYKDFCIRFFTPVILDWSGAKFSKSLYLKSDAYKDINKAFINYDNFVDTYGIEGLDKLWKEVRSWVSEPKKFFRNYSVDYFNLVMEEDE